MFSILEEILHSFGQIQTLSLIHAVIYLLILVAVLG